MCECTISIGYHISCDESVVPAFHNGVVFFRDSMKCLASKFFSKSNFLKINTYKYETLNMGLFLDVKLIFSSLRKKIRKEESETLFEHFIKYQWQMFTLRSWLAKYYFMRAWNCELIRSSCKTMLTFIWLLAIIILVDDIQKITDCWTHLVIIKDVSSSYSVCHWLIAKMQK